VFTYHDVIETNKDFSELLMQNRKGTRADGIEDALNAASKTISPNDCYAIRRVLVPYGEDDTYKNGIHSVLRAELRLAALFTTTVKAAENIEAKPDKA